MWVTSIALYPDYIEEEKEFVLSLDNSELGEHQEQASQVKEVGSLIETNRSFIWTAHEFTVIPKKGERAFSIHARHQKK